MVWGRSRPCWYTEEEALFGTQGHSPALPGARGATLGLVAGSLWASLTCAVKPVGTNILRPQFPMP